MYRPTLGRTMTAVAAVACLAVLIVVGVRIGFDESLAVLPWLVLAVGSCWATFVNPRVEVSDGGVRLVNVMRTIDIAWPAITAVDTRWMLTLQTDYGEFAAWAAPMGTNAVGRMGRAYRRGDLATVEAAHDPGRRIGIGDLPDTPSGAAALLIRRRWNDLRTAGHLDDPRLEHRRPPVRWHWPQVIVGATLAAAGVLLAR